MKPRILLTGGSSLLALNWACAVRGQWDVVLGIHKHRVQLHGATSVEIDLEDTTRFGLQLSTLSPELVVHTAGLTNVDECERQPVLAYHANAVIARTVAEATALRNIPLIHISTDHLFPGIREFHSEGEPVQPLNEYGRTKALAEQWVEAAHPASLIVRTNFFCWGHRRRQSFSDWLIRSLRDGKPLTLFEDVFFTPILTDRLVLAAHKLVEKRCSGVFNVGGGERMSKFEFGNVLAGSLGLPSALIQRGRVVDAELTAPRPHDMSLDSGKAIRALGHHVGMVKDYLEELRMQEIEGRRVELHASVAD